MMPHILYFVGAGLTRSLALPGKPIPIMTDFIRVMAEYADNTVVLTTLAELENAGVFEWSSSELRGLAQQLVGENAEEKRTPERIGAFKKLLKRRPSENIETLLRRASDRSHVGITAAFDSGSLPIRFNFAINRVFSEIGWNINSAPLEEFLGKQFSIPGTVHTFVSFNYDLVLDRYVQEQAEGRWDVRDGYGFRIARFIEQKAALEHMRQFDGNGAFSLLRAGEIPSPLAGDRTIRILKPHGSLNWLVAFRDNYHFEDRAPITCLGSDGSLQYYPAFNCRNVELGGRPRAHLGLFLLPPASKLSRHEIIRETIQQEKEALRQADEALVIGWSMPETDRDQECLIRSCVRDRSKSFAYVTVVNCGATPEYFQRVADVFGVDMPHIKVFNAGFQDFVDSL